MKHLYYFTFLLLSLTSTVNYGQTAFEFINIYNGSTNTSTSTNTLADIDGDGDLDAIVDHNTGLAWYENIDGLGTFGNKRLIGEDAVINGSLHTVDMDGDTDLDILLIKSYDIVWIENIDGVGTVWEDHIINDTITQLYVLHYGDLDGDGDIDVISANRGGSPRISLFENLDGSGTMGEEQIIAVIPNEYPNIHCSDVDSDGDLDIIASRGNLVWYENLDGNATFSPYHPIAGGSPDYYNFTIDDLDEDGDEDILIPNGAVGPYWRINNGGSFEEAVIIEVLESEATSMVVGDFDGDGDKDLIDNNNGVTLRLNNGDVTFTNAVSFGEAILESTRDLTVGDIDNDGDLDILSYIGGNLDNYWLENNGTAEFTLHFIGDAPQLMKSTAAADMDQDGDMDIVIGTESGVFWYEDVDGNLHYNTRHEIYYEGVMSYIFLSDMDADGDTDIIGFSGVDDALVWFEHLDGYGSFGPKTIISTSCDNPTMVAIADIDMDGDDDIVLTSADDNKVAWYANLDGQGTFSTEQVISASATAVSDVKIADMDGDGDLDVIVALQPLNSVIWYENNGSGLFTTEHLVTNAAIYLQSIDVNDIDGDGDMDVLTTFAGTFSRLIWFENIDGAGTFGDINYLGASNFFYTKVALADMDQDGDNDAVALYNNNQLIYWFANEDGEGSFGPPQTIASTYFADYSMHLTDIDEDGDIDVIASSADNWECYFELYKNLGPLYNQINGTISLDINEDGCDSMDPPAGSIFISTSNGMDTFSTFSSADGGFEMPVNLGYFTTYLEQLPEYYVASPEYHDSNMDVYGTTDTANFCLTPNATVNDLNVSILPLNEPRPGFDVSYVMIYKNVGTTTLSGTLTYQYDHTKLQFSSASQTISTQNANTLGFDFADLLPFESRSITLDFQVFAPPTTAIDDILLTTATISPLGADYTENDNVFELEEVVIGSYDPNDITCLQGDMVRIEDADDYLHYRIRFQNTGTADAINVRIEQAIDEKLDWRTMQIEDLSHEGTVTIANGTDLEVTFNNIHLPSTSMDEAASNGYVFYKIKPIQEVVVGDIVTATAEIYFDFNEAIFTNTATTTFIDNLSVDEDVMNLVALYPNPTEGVVYVVKKDAALLQDISVVHIDGRVLMAERLLNQQRHQVDLSGLSAGLYFVTVKTSLGSQTFKVIKR